MLTEQAGYQMNSHEVLSALATRSKNTAPLYISNSHPLTRNFLASMRQDHQEIAVLCRSAQAESLMPVLSGEEMTLLQQIGRSDRFARLVPTYQSEIPNAELDAIANRARKDALTYARNLIAAMPHAVPYIAELLCTRYTNDLFSLFQNADSIPRYHRDHALTCLKVPETVTIQQHQKIQLNRERQESFYVACVVHSLATALGAAETLLAQHIPPRNPVLSYAGIVDVSHRPSEEQLTRLGLCMDALAKVAYLTSYFLPHGDDFMSDLIRRRGYEGMLSAGSSFLSHTLFHHAPQSEIEVHSLLAAFFRDNYARGQSKAKMILTREADVATDPGNLNEMLWHGGNREDAADLSELLNRDVESVVLEHVTYGGLDRRQMYELRIEDQLQADKRGRDGQPVPYTEMERKLLSAVLMGDEKNVIVRLVKVVRDSRMNVSEQTMEEILEFVMGLVREHKPDELSQAWSAIVGEEPTQRQQLDLIVLAAMREEERKVYFRRQRQDVYDNAKSLLAQRAAVLQGRAYWENGPHAELFKDGKRCLIRRLERTIPAYLRVDGKLSMLNLMITLEKVKLLMRDFNVVPPSQYEALEAVVTFLQNPDIIDVIQYGAFPWQAEPRVKKSFLQTVLAAQPKRS